MNNQGFGMPATPSSFGASQMAQGYGAAPQPPRFSAGSLISDGDLPEWLREGFDPQGAQPQQPQQQGWGASQAAPPTINPAINPAMNPAMNPSWRQPESAHSDIDAQHTVRQPAFGAAVGAPSAPQPQFPFGHQPPAFPPQAPAPFQGGYQPQQPAYPAPQLPVYPPQSQAGYAAPQQPYQLPQPALPQSYPAQQAQQAQQAGGMRYPVQPAYSQAQPQLTPAAPVNAFPSIEQAGAAYNGPQVGGMAGHSLLDQQSLPNWLANQPGGGQIAPRQPVPSGMMARSLVDDQALPKWLRDQPEDAGRQNVSEWLGASAAHEPMPQFLSDAYAQAQVARAPQPNLPPAPQPPAPAQPGAAGGWNTPGGDTVLPDWLRAQANQAPVAPAPVAPPQSLSLGASSAAAQPEPAARFAASDLIDPNMLPDWVTARAPAQQAFSSTHGWSTINAGPESPFDSSDQTYGGGALGAASGLQGLSTQAPWNDTSWDPSGAQNDQGYDNQGFEDSHGYDGRSFDQQGYDQQGYDDQPYDDNQGYESRGSAQVYGRGQPLAPDELPPWLRGKGGQAASSQRAAPGRNPWQAASEPMDAPGGWDESAGWGEQSDQTGWEDPGAWDDRRGESQRGGWGRNAPPRDDWGDQPDEWGGAERRGASRRGHDDREYDDRGYDDRRQRRDEMAYEDDEPYEEQRGRGWLGFLRRNSH